ncbi:uncharacterized protein LOC111408456 [Olea europaea var. sylvestris]|uniref:uncharacterized protein LOC111408456 n=1 Tax=Olea europaea var. sylvestris TaxID=158386 RepID=UPI000C1D19E1|nr:uncharacterized protein LOC111408456 [Olea europaea var. sylvestris]
MQYFYIGLNPKSRANVDSACDGSITKRTTDQVYQIMEDLAFTSALWPTERTSVKKLAGIHEVDPLTAISAQLAALAKKVYKMNVIQTVGQKCKHCGGNHESVNCTVGSPFAQSLKDINYAQNFQRQQHNKNPNTYYPGWRNHPGSCYQEFRKSDGINSKSTLRKTSSNTETNPKQQVMTVKVMESEKIEAITTHSGVKLPEIIVERRVDKSKHLDKVVPSQELENLQVKVTALIKPYVPPVPFPHRLQKKKLEEQFAKFLDIFRKLHVNIPLIETLSQILNYAKFLKEILAKKRMLTDFETIKLNEECSAILQNKLPPKLQDPGSLKIPWSIEKDLNFNCLCDSGASINLMPSSVYRNLGLEELKDTSISLQLADKSIKYRSGVVQNVFIKVGKFIFLVDFVILDIEEPWNVALLIFGRSFLSTGRAIMDFESGELTLRVEDKQEKFKIYNTIENPLQEEFSKKVKEECNYIAA